MFGTEYIEPYFQIHEVKVQYLTDYKRKHPDIWCYPDKKLIVVTDEWSRQNANERRKRLVHEVLHLVGVQHSRKLKFSTFPDRDLFSIKVYNDIEKNKASIKAGKYHFNLGRFL